MVMNMNRAHLRGMNLATTFAPETTTTTVTGGPRAILHVEGAVAGLAALVAYGHLGGSWAVFAALFLVPDLSMLGYLAGRRIGAISYNAAHSTIGPAFVAAVALAAHVPFLLLGACIWLAHIGFDRMLGYGLKYGSGFGHTHLGGKGR